MMGVNANISESLTGTIEAPFPEFEAPPANPMEAVSYTHLVIASS